MNDVLVITRPVEDAAALKAAAEAAGWKVLSMPLLSIRFRDDVHLPALKWQAVAITSANGARAIARLKGRESLVQAKAVVVGAASARAVREAGFGTIVQARRNDVQGVIDAVRRTCRPEAGPVLYASGAVTRGDLQQALREAGFDVRRVVLYEAVAAQALSEETRQALREETGWVALYSPRTAKVWAQLVARAGLGQAAARWRHACLSRNVAETLHRHLPQAGQVFVAEKAEEAAMRRLLGLP